MNDILIQLATAFLGSLAFSVVFGVSFRRLIPASLGGLGGWVIYLLMFHWLHSEFAACLIASAFAALYGEVLARILKAPATIFFVPAVIPLIPGSSLYYTMSCAMRGDWLGFQHYGFLTGQFALGIAAGISLVWALSSMLRTCQHHTI